jgi:uncharacterized protein YcfJ
MTRAPIKTALAVAALALASQAAMAEITFYERDGYGGQTFTTERMVRNFERYGFNDRASSVVVTKGERWEVCEHQNFGGRCVILRGGRYATLQAMGLNDRVSSVREVSVNAVVDSPRYAPEPQPAYTVVPHERLYEADVVSVHAVVGQAERKCWIEREQVRQDGGANNAGGTIAGALIGGIIGHQIGGGTGRDIATVGGAVAGAAVGNNMARNGDRVVNQDVRKCSTVPTSARPDYWDVTYRFRGTEHTVQMTQPPGNTVTVNQDGEPRVRG